MFFRTHRPARTPALESAPQPLLETACNSILASGTLSGLFPA